MAKVWPVFWALLGYQRRPVPPIPAVPVVASAPPADDVIGPIVAQTGTLVRQEIDHLLATMHSDPLARQPQMVPLLVRGTSTSALDALANKTPAQALAPLARLAGGAWLALILLSLDGADAAPQPPR